MAFHTLLLGWTAIAIAVFLPGYLLSLALLGKKTGIVEQIVFSFAFGITVIPLAMVFLNRVFSIQVNALTLTTVIALTCIFSIIAYKKRK